MQRWDRASVVLEALTNLFPEAGIVGFASEETYVHVSIVVPSEDNARALANSEISWRQGEPQDDEAFEDDDVFVALVDTKIANTRAALARTTPGLD